MPTDRKKLSLRLFEKVWNEGKLELLDDMNTPNAAIHDPYVPIKTRGPAAAKEYLQLFRKAFPDLVLKVDDQIAEGDRVVTFLSVTGTHKGEFMGIAPTFTKSTVPSIVMLRFEEDRIAEARVLWDVLAFMRAAGVELPKVAAFAGT